MCFESFTCVDSLNTQQVHELEITTTILQVKEPSHEGIKEIAQFSMPSKGGLRIQIQAAGFQSWHSK